MFFVDEDGAFVENPAGWLERRCLGGLLEISEAYDVLDWQAEFFDDVLNSQVFALIQSRRDAGLLADQLIVANLAMPNVELMRRVYECFEDKAFTIHDLRFFHEILKQNWARRVIELQGRNLVENPDDVARAMDVLQQATETASAPESLQSVVEFFPEYREKRKAGEAVFSTGMPALDHLLDGGWRPGFYGVAGRMKQGKTMVLLQMAYHLALTGKKVLFVSYEMSREHLVDRLLASILSIETSLITKNQLEFEMKFDGEMVWAVDLVDNARAKLPQNLVIVKPRDTSVHGLRLLISRLGDVDTVFVDYAQIMTVHDKTNNDVERCRWVSRRLTFLSVEKDLPLISGLQLKRPDGISNRVPDSRDIQHSDQFAQDVSGMFYIVRSKLDGEPDWAVGSELILHLGLNRHGASGVAARFVVEDKFSRMKHEPWR